MSWIIVTEEDVKRQEEQTRERLMQWAKEARIKAEARDNWKKSQTCPHCGRCPPLPVWLY